VLSHRPRADAIVTALDACIACVIHVTSASYMNEVRHT